MYTHFHCKLKSKTINSNKPHTQLNTKNSSKLSSYNPTTQNNSLKNKKQKQGFKNSEQTIYLRKLFILLEEYSTKGLFKLEGNSNKLLIFYCQKLRQGELALSIRNIIQRDYYCRGIQETRQLPLYFNIGNFFYFFKCQYYFLDCSQTFDTDNQKSDNYENSQNQSHLLFPNLFELDMMLCGWFKIT
eukprot:TRINITY_DN14732_c0_g1_i6.p1 TRINITY_DN14732_c0_g1~~TRINITY_DN14732_c0_g1_i6.p1  ORF type:complete len:187 (+),score=-5.93 TRINITY_DN14732_c0_g1_i6:382-942(+)